MTRAIESGSWDNTARNIHNLQTSTVNTIQNTESIDLQCSASSLFVIPSSHYIYEHEIILQRNNSDNYGMETLLQV